MSELLKAGEGSRGGKVIGHTSSGKPIYAGNRARDYTDFNSNDHKDANSHHMHLVDKLDKKISSTNTRRKVSGQVGPSASEEKKTELFKQRDHHGNKILKKADVSLSDYNKDSHISKSFSTSDTKVELIRKIVDHNLTKGHIDQQTHDQALAQLDKLIEKGGEGSRGGQVIGHTRSGKPIYKDFHHEDHSNFSAEDHNDAAEKNQQMGTNVNKNQGSGVLAHSYFERARKHKAEWKKAQKK